MRKALTIPAIALAAAMALGTTATAFAATTPTTTTTTPADTAPPASPTAAPTPQPGKNSLGLSTDFGRPGDTVVVTVRTGEKSASVTSRAFTGGRVDLKSDGKGTWTGTATVAKDVKTGYYGVQAFAGAKQFDTVKFSTEAGGTPDVKPTPKPTPKPTEPTKPPQPHPQPLKPSEHKKPKGSVNTGEAPAGTPVGTPAGTPADSLSEPGRA
ncbi:hypothetical protein [Streptomyces erythrochromogenes]|uniref:hypothetical protein n=1 Tax=Streptomyces erythrochromogenes TaxID=285574 RepID=UPI0038631DF9|nr:hypothetical protein OG364_22705 [Streptomyces erythrochromogenes]